MEKRSRWNMMTEKLNLADKGKSKLRRWTVLHPAVSRRRSTRCGNYLRAGARSVGGIRWRLESQRGRPKGRNIDAFASPPDPTLHCLRTRSRACVNGWSRRGSGSIQTAWKHVAVKRDSVASGKNTKRCALAMGEDGQTGPGDRPRVGNAQVEHLDLASIAQRHPLKRSHGKQDSISAKGNAKKSNKVGGMRRQQFGEHALKQSMCAEVPYRQADNVSM